MSIFKAEQGIEAIKKRLAHRVKFCARAAFEFLDINGDGIITATEFRNVLADSGFYATDREVAGLMYRLDANKDNRVTL